MRKQLISMLAIVLYLVPGFVRGQELASTTRAEHKSVLPPPRPGDNGPSLAQTAQSVRESLTSHGSLEYRQTSSVLKGVSFHNSYSIPQVQADPSTCMLRIKEAIATQIELAEGVTYNENGKAISGADLNRSRTVESTASLRDVAWVTVEPAKTLWERAAAENGQSITITLDPPVYLLTLKSPNSNAFTFHENYQVGLQPGQTHSAENHNYLTFASEEAANRAARALIRAAELCGGGRAAVEATPAIGGPTLEITANFIQKKLNDQGPVNVVVYVHDDATDKNWSNQVRFEVSNVNVDPADCKLAYHWNMSTNQANPSSLNLGFYFKNVSKIAVTTLDQRIKDNNTERGRPSYSNRVEPSVFDLAVYLKDKTVLDFNFFDEELADRVAKAMLHSVELCGGGQEKEPF